MTQQRASGIPVVPSELTCADVERDREQARQLIQAMLPEERLD